MLPRRKFDWGISFMQGIISIPLLLITDSSAANYEGIEKSISDRLPAHFIDGRWFVVAIDLD